MHDASERVIRTSDKTKLEVEVDMELELGSNFNFQEMKPNLPPGALCRGVLPRRQCIPLSPRRQPHTMAGWGQGIGCRGDHAGCHQRMFEARGFKGRAQQQFVRPSLRSC
jgi:hypothetical protein